MTREQDSNYSKRYESFRDESGAWTFDIAEYHSDLNSLTDENIPPDPNPEEAYRAAVFLEGYIDKQRTRSTWSDDALDSFDSFGSTTEVEAVARALRQIAGRTK